MLESEAICTQRAVFEAVRIRGVFYSICGSLIARPTRNPFLTTWKSREIAWEFGNRINLTATAHC
jgi:hypothetical protein